MNNIEINNELLQKSLKQHQLTAFRGGCYGRLPLEEKISHEDKNITPRRVEGDILSEFDIYLSVVIYHSTLT